MARMFASRIQQFVLSVDIMEDDTFASLLELIADYAQCELDLAFFALLEVQVIDRGKCLRTAWATREQRPSFTIPDGSYMSQAAWVFGECKPVWVVAAEGGPLSSEVENLDRWSGCEDLPPYIPLSDAEVRTSIMLPLIAKDGAVGLIEFASIRLIEPTPSALVELRLLADVVAHAYQMRAASRQQRTSTRSALKMLLEAREQENWRRLALPSVFVASSGRADPAVIEAIRAVLAGFEGRLAMTYWADVTESGSINDHLLKAISESDYGICYFSEKAEGGTPHEFEDNRNVVFEAGMMQALTNSPTEQPAGWVPIREVASCDVPFDFASERILIVPRTADGELDLEAFSHGLRDRIATLLHGQRGDAEAGA